jgi:hypothetical protein
MTDELFEFPERTPRLASVTVPAISSALGLSQPYAAEIRAGRQCPHPRHWQILARLVEVPADGGDRTKKDAGDT